MVRGDVGSALTLHPLIIVVVTWLIGVWIAGFYRRSGRRAAIDPGLVNQILLLTGMLFVVTWAIRFMTGSLPPV